MRSSYLFQLRGQSYVNGNRTEWETRLWFFHPPSLWTSSGSGRWIGIKRLRGESWPFLSPEKRDHYRVSLWQECREDGLKEKGKKKEKKKGADGDVKSSGHSCLWGTQPSISSTSGHPSNLLVSALFFMCWRREKKKKHKTGFVFLILLDKPELKRMDSLLFTAPSSDTKQGWADKNMQRPGTNKSWWITQITRG